MHSSNTSEVAGTIAWEILASPNWTTLYAGRRELKPDGIDVFPANHGAHRGPKPKSWTPAAAAFWLFDFYIKQIYLEGGFLIRLYSRPVSDRKNLGVALSAQKAPANNTHSFEFFALEGEERAAHPTNGEMRINMARGPKGWEVAYTEFLTDIDLRIHTDDMVNPGCLLGIFSSIPGPLWKVRILRGSYIHWPLVAEAVDAAPPN